MKDLYGDVRTDPSKELNRHYNFPTIYVKWCTFESRWRNSMTIYCDCIPGPGNWWIRIYTIRPVTPVLYDWLSGSWDIISLFPCDCAIIFRPLSFCSAKNKRNWCFAIIRGCDRCFVFGRARIWFTYAGSLCVFFILTE